jgi:hypothetical protein
MLLDPGEKLAPDVYENLPCCLNLLSKRKIIRALKIDIPEPNFIKGNSIKSNGAAKIILPAKTRITPKKRESITIRNLIFFEIFLEFALENEYKAKTKTIKIIIPKNIKFIY